ncbi:MAG: response regulator [Desulfobacteraceae bacterium]|jgi:signal transduction histidine kinase
MMPIATIKASSEVVYKYNLATGKYEYLIPITSGLSGFSTTEWMEKSCQDLLYLIHPHDLKRVQAHFDRLYKGGAYDPLVESSLEYRLKTNDGGYRWFSDKHALLMGPDGRPDAVIGNIRDLTKEQLVERTLHKYAHIVSKSKDYLALIDRNYTYQAISKAYAHTLKRDRDDIIGKTVAEIFGTESFNQIIKPMADRCLGGKNTRFQIWMPFAGDDRKLLDIEYTPHYEKGQKEKTVSGYVECTRDITDLKKLEAQLLQTCKMEAIGMLAGGIAHDFNNILSAIIGYAELSVAQTPKTSELYAYQQQILQAGQRAADLIKHILEFSRKNRQELQPVQIKNVLNEVLDFIRASLPATIAIERKIESEAYVMGDATHIYQILLNLCVNAGFAMRQRGGFLKIRLSEVELDAETIAPYSEMRPGRYLKLRVSDTGTGMTPEIKKRIFDPFFTTKEKGKGTGMGLSLAYDIIKSYGGGITVESAPGHGTLFDVYFPAVKSAKPAEADIDVDVRGGSEKILFVDDEDTLVDLGKQMIEFLGYRVTALVNSLEALDLFKKDPYAFDLVITDLVMPGMSGDELAQNILAIRPDIPVVLITGFSEQMTSEKAELIGVKKLVTKPIAMKDMARLIRDALV